MLNFIRVVLIGFMVLTVAGCTTVKAKSGFSVRVSGYEFTCTTEPKQKLLNKKLAKALAAAAAEGVTRGLKGGVIMEKGASLDSTFPGTDAPTENKDAEVEPQGQEKQVTELIAHTREWIKGCQRLAKISAKQ